MAEAVARDQTDLVVFPELSITGRDNAGSRAEAITGPACQRLVQFATRHRVHIVAGIAESDESCLYNTAVLVGPSGLIGSYRKIHLTTSDAEWATAGLEWKFFDTVIGRIGFVDRPRCDFPGIGTGAGAVWLRPDRLPGGTGRPVYRRAWRHRGRAELSDPDRLGSVSLASVPGAGRREQHLPRLRQRDRSGQWFYGASGVFGPDTFEFPRRESQVLDGEGIASAVIDTTNAHDVYPTNVVRRKDLVLMRLPNHYQPLVIGSRANTATGSANVELLSVARAAQAR